MIETPHNKTVTVFAPAKLNLFLHITGRLNNGYHTLDSLVSFADIGDSIEIEPASAFSFHVQGAFAKSFNAADTHPFSDGSNLVIKAARALSQVTNKPLNVKITLTKNLPIASGIGGGSSDAAATLWGLQDFWGLPHNPDYILPLMTKLGADIPVCFTCQPSLMRGIGDKLFPSPLMPEIPILLINPLLSCPTENVFLHHNGIFKNNITLPERFTTVFDLINTLDTLGNDLYEPACKLVPAIGNIINALTTQKECLLARMSGSGASCFGLFETTEDAETAQQAIRLENPDWWIKTGWLNRPERY